MHPTIIKLNQQMQVVQATIKQALSDGVLTPAELTNILSNYSLSKHTHTIQKQTIEVVSSVKQDPITKGITVTTSKIDVVTGVS